MERKHKTRRQRCRGQATGELLAALVGLTVLFAGIIQVAQLGDAATANQLDAMLDAQRNSDNSLSRQALSMRQWEDGSDGLALTSDDNIVPGNSGQTSVMALELTAPLPVENVVERDWMITELGAGTGFAANLYEGETDRTVPLEPALKKMLFMTTDSLRVTDRAYLPGLSIDGTITGGMQP